MDYLGEVFPVPTCTGSVDKEVLVSGRDRVLPPGDRVKVCLNLKMQLLSHDCELWSLWENRKGDILVGVTDPNLHEEV